jgi:hypothetical protein
VKVFYIFNAYAPSTRRNAKRVLDRPELKKEILVHVEQTGSGGAKIGRPKETIMLSVNGFKSFAMLAQTTMKTWFDSLSSLALELPQNLANSKTCWVRWGLKVWGVKVWDDDPRAFVGATMQTNSGRHSISHHPKTQDTCLTDE